MEAPEEAFEDVVCFHHQPFPSPEEYPIKPPLDFMVDDLLNFSNNDALSDIGVLDLTGEASSVSPALVSSSSSAIICCPISEAICRTFPDNPFPGPDLHVPYEEVAELEWLSNFVEESFSSDDLQKLEELSKEAASPGSERNGEKGVRGKARSKRARAGACNWTRRRLVSPETSSEEGTSSGGESVWEKQVVGGKRERGDEGGGGSCGRRCVHCDTDKTPQWRTGPMGPKTLCNACGVRYKSGRLVPEYRPASSPTFVLTKHSNSHRKVMELRRQKETHLHHQQRLQLQLLEDTMIMDNVYDDDEDHHHQYLITDNWVNEGSYLL